MSKLATCLAVLAWGLSVLACSLGPAASAALPTATVAAIPAATPTPILALIPPPTVAPPPAPASTLAVTQAPTPPPTPSAQPPLGTPVPLPAGPPQELKPCSLLTAAEAEAILGQPAAPSQEVNGACAIANAKDGLTMVSVTAAQGQQAEGILQGQAFLLGMAGVPLDGTKMARLKELSDAGDFAGFFAEMVALAQGAPAVQARLVDGMGDAGYWAWLTASSRRQGALVVARGQTLINVNVVVADSQSEPDVLAACQSLVEQVFGRLPANFSLAASAAAPPPPQAPPAAPTIPPPPPTWTPTPDPNAPPPGFVEQPSYTGDCKKRPAGSICLGYADKYIWFISPFGDEVVGGGEVGTWQGKQIHATFGKKADYQHILGTNLIRKVAR